MESAWVLVDVTKSNRKRSPVTRPVGMNAEPGTTYANGAASLSTNTTVCSTRLPSVYPDSGPRFRVRTIFSKSSTMASSMTGTWIEAVVAPAVTDTVPSSM